MGTFVTEGSWLVILGISGDLAVLPGSNDVLGSTIGSSDGNLNEDALKSGMRSWILWIRPALISDLDGSSLGRLENLADGWEVGRLEGRLESFLLGISEGKLDGSLLGT